MTQRATALDTYYANSLKTANGLPQELFDEIEAVIRDYCGYEEYKGRDSKDYRPSIRHGEGMVVGGELTSWHFNPTYADGRVTVCFLRHREWWDDCFLDELPVEFLLYILNLIKERRNLTDYNSAEIIEKANEFSKVTTQERRVAGAFKENRLEGIL